MLWLERGHISERILPYRGVKMCSGSSGNTFQDALFSIGGSKSVLARVGPHFTTHSSVSGGGKVL